MYKVSVKGDNAGFLSSAEKSIEASIQDVGGEKFSFSALMSKYEALNKLAGQMVVVETAKNKGKNKSKDAKTDNILIKISQVSENDIDEERICGPEDPTDAEYGFKPYSTGYRVARLIGVTKVGKEWRMSAYVGNTDDDIWNTKKSKIPEVTFTGSCAQDAAMTHMLYSTGNTIIFDYGQKKENGKYYVSRAAVINY